MTILADLRLDHGRAPADVEGAGFADQLVAQDPGCEDVELELDGREVVVGRQRPEGRPRRDRIPERGPDSAVDEAARQNVQVNL